MSTFIEDWTIISPLGRGKNETLISLKSNKRPNFKEYTFQNKVLLAMPLDVEGELPVKGFDAYDSRNNRLLYQCIQDMGDAFETLFNLVSKDRIGIAIGTSTSGILEAENGYKLEHREGRWSDTYHYRQHEFSSPSDFLKSLFDLKGPCLTISTACSSSAKVFATAKRWLDQDLCDAVIVGGCDTLCDMTLLGFDSLGAYSANGCEPYTLAREGIHIGEAAGLFILSKKESNLIISGVGESTDAHHISAPDPEGHGAARAMTSAIVDANLQPDQIDYINLHGTGTSLNDQMEAKAIRTCFKKDLPPMSSTKGYTGHTLGAAGALEAGISLLSLSLDEAFYPLHYITKTIDPEFEDLNFVSEDFKSSKKPKIILSNSFAFGGSNCSLVFRRS